MNNSQFIQLKRRLTQAKWIGGSLLCAVTLAGCGGGGGGSASTPPVAPSTPSPAPTQNPTQNPTPAPTSCSLTAQTGGIASSALAQINQYRTAAFGSAGVSSATLTLDTLLTISAGNHANYLSLLTQPGPNLDPRNHSELATNPCFTGTTVSARIAATGDSDTVVGENFSETSFAASTTPALASQTGAATIDGLFDAVYHRMSLLSNFTNVGIAWQMSNTANLPPLILNVDLAQHQANRYSQFITYPYNGQTGVLLDWLVDENPCPLGCNNTGRFSGFPITIQTDGRALVVNSFTVTSASGAVQGQVLTATATSAYAADQNLVSENALDRAAFVPFAPLSPNTTYTVAVSGTSGGVSFNQSWSFTTLAGTNLQLSNDAPSPVVKGGTFDLKFSGGSQNYQVNPSSQTSILTWSASNGAGSPAVSLNYVQIAPNYYQFTYSGQCTLSAGCPVTFTGTDSLGNTATTQVTVLP